MARRVGKAQRGRLHSSYTARLARRFAPLLTLHRSTRQRRCRHPESLTDNAVHGAQPTLPLMVRRRVAPSRTMSWPASERAAIL